MAQVLLEIGLQKAEDFWCQAVIAESFERIHRSNLIGMGVLPLEFIDNENKTNLVF